MRHYHRLEMLRESARAEGVVGFVRTVIRLSRDVVLSQHRVVFGLYVADNSGTIADGETHELHITEIPTVDAVDEELWLALSQNRRYIWRDVRWMFNYGFRLWVGRCEGKLACVLWTISGDRQGTYFFPMTDRCTLIAHCVTLPGYRRKGFFTTGMKYVTAALAREGYRRFYVDCSDWNDASRRAIERAGFRRIGRAKCRRRGRLLWYQEALPDVARFFRADG